MKVKCLFMLSVCLVTKSRNDFKLQVKGMASWYEV